MAGHAQLKFVMTECSKTQIRLTRHILSMQRTTKVLIIHQIGKMHKLVCVYGIDRFFHDLAHIKGYLIGIKLLFREVRFLK